MIPKRPTYDGSQQAGPSKDYLSLSAFHEHAVAVRAVRALRAMVDYHVHDETWRNGDTALREIEASGWKE